MTRPTNTTSTRPSLGGGGALGPAFNALRARGTGQPPGVCGGPRNSYAPCLERTCRKVPVSAVCKRPQAAALREALNRRATANRSPNCW